ncbi:MAG: HAD family phosphatase [Candidatus Nomurabacteria bacterium]|jgi:epoxide hydrolase-like predicted phosphatase|nr:HAD family phosphatase [Candidatus Nomurabacteria bacterium]
MIRAIIFDCFGVLISDAYTVIKREYPELYADPARATELARLSAKSGLGLITSEERKTRIAELLDSVGISGKSALEKAISGIEGNTALLAEIKELRKHYKIGLLSNVGIGFWKRFTKEETTEYFDDVVLSYQVGLVKPDPRIFELAAERLGVEVSECVFIDDDEKNVKSAKDCGMQGITYDWDMDIKKALKNIGVTF